MENEIWRWVWTILAVVMGVGEIFTAGFFLLPFAIGAATAAVIAWFDGPVLLQWVLFFVVSGASFLYLRRFSRTQDDDHPSPIGANRYLDAEGLVLDTVDPTAGTGMVRVDTEEWRATSEAGGVIPAGLRVRVVGVRGSRLVVRPEP